MAKIRQFNINGMTAEIETSELVEVETASAGSLTKTLKPNTLCICNNPLTALSITLATPSETDIVNEYHMLFITDDTTPITLTLPSGITWNTGSQPQPNLDKHCEISIMYGVGYFQEL